jgi:hypothetical protein
MKTLIKNILPALMVLVTTLTYSNNTIEDLADRISKNDSFDKYCWNIAGFNVIRVSKLSLLTEEEQKLNIEKVSALATKLNYLSDATKEEFATLIGFSNLEDYNFLTGNMDKNMLNIKSFFPELQLLDKETLEQTMSIAFEKWSTYYQDDEAKHAEMVKCLDRGKHVQHQCDNHHKITKWVIFGVASVGCAAAAWAAYAGAIATLGAGAPAAVTVGGACSALLLGIVASADTNSGVCSDKYANAIAYCSARWGN